MTAICSHLDEIQMDPPESVPGCEDCLRIGGQWVHLRVCTLNHPNLWQLLVGERGWTPEQYERWCADAACAELLKRPG